MTKDEATALLATALHDIAPEVDLGAVDRDLPLQEVAGLDSISFMALVTAIHDRTGIQIPFQDYQAGHAELLRDLPDGPTAPDRFRLTTRAATSTRGMVKRGRGGTRPYPRVMTTPNAR